MGLPFGSKTAKFTSGQKVDIPLLVRKQRHADIISMFKQTVEGQAIVLSDSTMQRILNSCSASRSKAATCVNYFEASAGEVTI